MDGNQELREILNELSNAISKSLSTPETLVKLEQLHQRGYQLYLIMEPSSGVTRKHNTPPIMPIQIFPDQQENDQGRQFDLTDDDKDFLRTLKIKVD